MRGRPLRAAGLALIASLFAGAVSAALLTHGGTFTYRLLGYSTLFASLLMGFVAGEYLDYMRRRESRVRNIAMLLAIAAAFALFVFLIGSNVPPLVGASDNRFLFPTFFVLGIVAGFFGHSGKNASHTIEKKAGPGAR